MSEQKNGGRPFRFKDKNNQQTNNQVQTQNNQNNNQGHNQNNQQHPQNNKEQRKKKEKKQKNIVNNNNMAHPVSASVADDTKKYVMFYTIAPLEGRIQKGFFKKVDYYSFTVGAKLASKIGTLKSVSVFVQTNEGEIQLKDFPKKGGKFNVSLKMDLIPNNQITVRFVGIVITEQRNGNKEIKFKLTMNI